MNNLEQAGKVYYARRLMDYARRETKKGNQSSAEYELIVAQFRYEAAVLAMLEAKNCLEIIRKIKSRIV